MKCSRAVCQNVCVLLCVRLGHTKLIRCHICASWLSRDLACPVPHMCLLVCVSMCMTGKAMGRKRMWHWTTYRGHHPRTPGVGLYNTELHTHRRGGRHAIYRGALGSCHMCLQPSPSPPPHLASSPFFSRSRRISKQTQLERRINEININILRHWQACKLKSGDGTLAIFSEEMSLETEWISKGGLQIGLACVCTHKLERACLCQPSVLIKHTGV